MERDEEYAKKLFLEAINGSSSIHVPLNDPDAALAWRVAHEEDSYQDNHENNLDIFTDNDVVSRPSHVHNKDESDDAQIAMQLDEQMKLCQEQDDALLAQKLHDEEERKNRGALNPTQQNNIRQRLLAQQRRQGRGGVRMLFPRGRHSNDLEEDGADEAGVGFIPFAPRFPGQGRGARHNPFSTGLGRGPHHHHHHHHHPFFPIDEGPGMPMFGFLQRLGVENNVDLSDYEALWELAERIGDAKQSGISKEDIAQLPTHAYNQSTSPDGATSKDEREAKKCQICLSDFSDGEGVKTLPCLHMYHTSCIDKWLQRKGECPICRDKIKKGRN